MTRDYDNRSQMPSSASTLHSLSPHPSSFSLPPPPTPPNFLPPLTPPRAPPSVLSCSSQLAFASWTFWIVSFELNAGRLSFSTSRAPTEKERERRKDPPLAPAHYTPILFISIRCRVCAPFVHAPRRSSLLSIANSRVHLALGASTQ